MALTVDYFTEDEFRETTGDVKSPYKYELDAIDRAQDEIIDRLERWGKTSWSTRSITETFSNLGTPLLLLRRIPVIAISDFTQGGLAVDEYNLDLEEGSLRWGTWVFADPPVITAGQAVSVSYTYGFALSNANVPWSVKRPCIRAARSLLRLEQANNMPENVSRYSTEKTQFDFLVDAGFARTVGGKLVQIQNEPWPWDSRSSRDIRSYWDSRRPRSIVTT